MIANCVEKLQLCVALVLRYELSQKQCTSMQWYTVNFFCHNVVGDEHESQ